MATPDPLPTVSGPANPRQVRILLINPNSTPTMTSACLATLSGTLPPATTVTGFTAPQPSPSAVEGHVDGALSTAACLRALATLIPDYDAFLVACFSAHPLIPALREEIGPHQPCMGIMEAALYASRICGGRLGVLTTSLRSKVMHDDAVAGVYGLGQFSVGCEAARIPVLDLERKDRGEVKRVLADTAKGLVEGKGADCICLGCAGMTEMRDACVEAVGGGGRAMVVDGVGVGCQFLAGLVREGLGTAKGGIYSSAKAGREARGQDWY